MTVRSIIPQEAANTILFIKNGEVVDKQVGAAPKAALVDMINKHI